MSFWRVYYHLVWATKNREPLITPEVETRLFGYIIRKAAEVETRVYAINSWNDHLHLIASIPPKVAVAEAVKTIKGASAHDLNYAGGFDGSFAWQRGYGVLSVGERQKHIAIAYVEAQKRHHQQNTTNPWLERYSDLDEGPPEIGITIGAVSPILREPQAAYDLLGEPLF